ncbi:hypothetical protein FAZ21_06570 [Chitiniphilus eburneus]|uniref:Uncharacterized protein n=1 Tax=Chitiniphilus eburneus TaxID=2571148 RepID=A0A4U0Q3M0_9NEIS|nr:hypothetical protein FAZ21_06570 [Chitiniphilus eburneus]
MDRDKLSSYSAQLFADGVLTGTKSSHQSSEHSGSKFDAGIKGLLSAGGSDGESIATSLERHFDASWTLPLNVINALDERGMIHRELSTARFGNLVMVKGRIQFVDLRMVQGIWGPIMELSVGSQKNAMTSAQRRKQSEGVKTSGALVQILSKLPHALQMRMYGFGNQIWASLKHESMIVNPEDFAFKHGDRIPGEWVCLGLLDAVPDADDDDIQPIGFGDIEEAMLNVLNVLKEQFGRRPSDYGVTPIAIFRKVDPA